MIIYKFILTALTVAILCYYLKSIGSDLFIPALIISGILLLSFIAEFLVENVQYFAGLIDRLNMDKSMVKHLFKIIGVAYAVEFSAGIIEDLGIKNLSDKVVFGGKIILLCMALPLFELFIETIFKFLE